MLRGVSAPRIEPPPPRIIEGDFAVDQAPPPQYTEGRLEFREDCGYGMYVVPRVIIAHVERIMEHWRDGRRLSGHTICHFTTDVDRVLEEARILYGDPAAPQPQGVIHMDPAQPGGDTSALTWHAIPPPATEEFQRAREEWDRLREAVFRFYGISPTLLSGEAPAELSPDDLRRQLGDVPDSAPARFDREGGYYT